MGSTSVNQSSTAYTNTPQTQEGDNPIALNNASGNILGSGNIQGNVGSLTTTDLNSIAKSFGLAESTLASSYKFGADAIKAVSEATRQNNIIQASGGASTYALPDILNNKSLIYSAVALAALYIWTKK